jgi:hypothetical protein
MQRYAVNAMKVDRGNRGIAVYSLHLNTTWTLVVTVTLWPLDPKDRLAVYGDEKISSDWVCNCSLPCQQPNPYSGYANPVLVSMMTTSK